MDTGGEQEATFVYVLRRVAPEHHKAEALISGAFSLKANESGLSVYAPHLASPRRLLQDWIDTQTAKSISPNENEKNRAKASKRLAETGNTPEQTYAAGWRVARVSCDAFHQAGLIIEPPDAAAQGDQIGHCNVPGSRDAFLEARAVLIEASVLLTEAETLAN